MLFSSLTALCTQLFSLFTFTSVGDEALHAGSINKLGHSDPSFESSSGDDQVVHNAPSNPYRLTDKWQGSNFFDGWDFWTHKYARLPDAILFILCSRPCQRPYARFGQLCR